MRFVFAVLTALSLGIGGFVATGHDPTSAGPSSTLFYCRPWFRIFNCFLPTTTTTTSTTTFTTILNTTAN